MARFVAGVSLALVCLCVFSLAQSDPAAGILPFSTQAGGPIDSVDLATGSITLHIPIRNKAGKVPFSFSLTGGSHAYIQTATGGARLWNVTTGILGTPFASSLGVSVPITFASNQTCGHQTGDFIWSISAVVDATGAAHPMPTPGTQQWDTEGCHNPKTQTYVTADGSGYTLTGSVSNQGAFTVTVYDRAGNLLNLTTRSWTDPDGTTMSISGPVSATYTDTVNTTAITSTINSHNGGPGPDTYVYSDISGNQQTVTVSYTQENLQTVFGCTGITDLQGPRYLPTTITLPTGASYELSYEATPGYSGYVTGRLAQITLPSGGVISYTYTGGNNNSGANCAGEVPTLTRTVSSDYGSGTWTYVNSDTGTSQNYTVTETDPAGNTITNYFAGEYETERIVQDVNLGTLSTTITCYNGNISNCPAPSSPPTLPITETNVYTSLGSSAYKELVTTYDSTYGNVLSVLAYDFGASTPTSQTYISYGQSWNGSFCTAYPSGVYITNTPCYSHTENSSGTDIAKTQITYSNSGHPTSTAQWVSGSTWLTSTASFNPNGTLAWSKDAAGNPTTPTYSSSVCNGMMPTSITTAIGTEYLTYDTVGGVSCVGAVVIADKDVNGNTTSYSYSDPLWRLTQVTYPIGYRQIAYSTGSATPWTITTTDDINGTNTLPTVMTLDGLGRNIEVYQATEAKTRTAYNALGQVYSVTNPYFTTSDPTYGFTYYTYDALGRVIQVTNPDGSARTTSYSSRAWKTTDESGTQKIYQMDGLGRLLYVCDGVGTSGPQQGYNPASCGLDIGGTGFLTTYGYNTVGQMASANVISQSRSFTYDGTGRMTSETNPETGLTTYTYDTQSVGDLYQRNRPKANQTSTSCPGNCTTTTYFHDAAHRLTEVEYSDGTPTVNLTYDQSSASGHTITNGIGQLTDAAASGSSNVVFSYDQMGRLQDQWQCTPLNCGTGTTHLNYQYNHLGQVSSFLDSEAGATYSYGYDGYARLQNITSSLDTPPNYPSPLYTADTYNALGQVLTATLGNNVGRTISYDQRGRPLTLTDGSIYGYTLYYTGNNITEANDSNGNWAYSYDYFNRLATSCSHNTQHPCPSSPLQAFSYAYDPLGNRWSQTVTAGTGPQPSHTFDANNHINNSGSGITYDALGNELTDGMGNTYMYDAESRIKSASGNFSISYAYDGLGRRIEQDINNTKYDYVYSQSGIADIWTPAGLLWAQLDGDSSLGIYANGTTTFYHENWLGTMRAMSTATGSSFSDCSSLPFGDSLNCTIYGPGDMQFTGQEWDDINLTHFPMRNYSMTQGRWTTTDPAGLSVVDPTNPQSWNRYAYVLNNPLSNIDPTGLDLIELQWEGGSGLFDSDALIAAGFDIQFGDDGDVSSIEPPSSGVQITDASGNITGTIGPDSNVFAGVVQLDQSVTVTASPDGGPETMSAVTGNYVVTPGAYGGPMAPSAQRMLNTIARSAPRICGGGAFAYGGLHGEKGNLEGAGMGLLEYDTQTGWQTGSLLEGSAGLVGVARIDYTDGGGTDYLLLAGTPFAGTFGSKSSLGVYGGSPTFGGGAYVNVTTNAGCKHK